MNTIQSSSWAKLARASLGFAAMAAATCLISTSVHAQPLPGAIFTTESVCDGTNVNIFTAKSAVYLDGGPAHTGAAGLPDGTYYVKVTEPNGTLLGTSVGSSVEKPVTVSGGEFAQCYQLQAILIKASGLPGQVAGYDTTTNGGGEYKVWISQAIDFAGADSKTDNFKVKGSEECLGGECGPILHAIGGIKFYDLNANGVYDAGDTPIAGWVIKVDATLPDATTVTSYLTTDVNGVWMDAFPAGTTYKACELYPLETNWIQTYPVATCWEGTTGNIDISGLDFGNVCLGAGGGLTLGFWSNKNGQALVGADDLALLVGLNLRNANGSAFDPATYASLRTWLLNGTAINMAYMLSVQLAAMELNVLNGNVVGTALIFAPGTTSANALGFASVNAVMAEANTELGLHADTTSGGAQDAFRAYQQALKNALDAANNNLNFVSAEPCPHTFSIPQ
jgi:hypothetical protein